MINKVKDEEKKHGLLISFNKKKKKIGNAIQNF